MSKESRRLGEIKELRKQRKKAAKALREKQQAQGLLVPVKVVMPNCIAGQLYRFPRKWESMSVAAIY